MKVLNNNDEKLNPVEIAGRSRRAKARPTGEVFAALDERLMILSRVQTLEESAIHVLRIYELLDELKRAYRMTETE